LGPFDDEETRAFYCDIPDLLTTIPPALLGLSEEEIESRKASNAVKYGIGGGGAGSAVIEDDSVDAQEVTPTSEAQLDAAEQGEMFVDDDEQGMEVDGGECLLLKLVAFMR
jgi:regulator of nonsense transcripts 2